MSRLKNVHRRFLELERLQAEKVSEKRISPLEFLLNLTQDEQFAWLRPMSSKIADLDALLDETEEAPENRKFMLGEIAAMLSSPHLKDRYESHVMNDPDFAFLHAQFMHAMDALAK
jgi:hypothetical protein